MALGESQLQHIAIDQIQLNPEQPRRVFDATALDELAASISDRGILQPLLVEACAAGYILHAGERRLRAARQAGLTHVPAQVLPPLNGAGRGARVINAFVENVLREDMTPIEEARAISEMRSMGLTNLDISQRTGININTIAQRLVLLDLDPELQDLVAKGELPRDHRVAKALLSVADKNTRIKLGARLARPGITVNAILDACRRINEKLAQQEAVVVEKRPALAISGAAGTTGKPVKWRDMRAAAQGMCDTCDLKSGLAGIAEPAWSIVLEMTGRVCDRCSLRANASLDICRQCPAVDLLRRLVPNG